MTVKVFIKSQLLANLTRNVNWYTKHGNTGNKTSEIETDKG